MLSGFNKIRKNQSLDSLISITESSDHPFLYVKVAKKIKFNIFSIDGKKGDDFERSQDRPKAYVRSAAFAISKSSYFLKFISKKNPKFSRATFNQKSCTFIKIKNRESFDINSVDDLNLARVIK